MAGRVGDNELHAALREGQDLEAIRLIVENNPALLRQRCARRGFLPLHWAIYLQSPPDVVRYLLEQCPDSIRKTTTKTNKELPAHMAASVGSDMETARLIVRAWPEALRVRNRRGLLPVHLARGVRLIRFFVEEWPESIQESTGDRYELTLLHSAVERGEDLQTIQFLVERCPQLVQTRGKYGDTPLHFVSAKTELDVVEYLVAQWEGSLNELNIHGYLPLHSAVEDDGSSAEIVDFLIAQAPQSVRVRAKDGSLPVHLAVHNYQEDDEENLNVIRRLVAACPDSLLVATENGLLPLHGAAQRAKFPVVRFLAERNPESVHETTGEGWLALHLVLELDYELLLDVEGVRSMYETARFLIDQFPQSLLISTNEEGYLPLHVAAMSGYDFEEGEDVLLELNFFNDLFRWAPEAVQIASNAGLFPFQYAIQQGGLSMPAVEFLAQQWPDALGQVDGDGRTVMHMAVSRTPVSLDLVEFLAEQRPQLLGATERNGSNPLHAAVAQIQPNRELIRSRSRELLELVRYLAEQRPESLAEADDRGSLPLHLAAERGLPGLEMARLLVVLRPQALMTADSNGSLPVHVAVGLGQPCFELVTFLVEQRPQSLGVADARGAIPLHVAVARDTCSHQLVQFLVKRSLRSVKTRNTRSGMLPLFLAAKSDAPLDVLFFLVTTWPGGVCENRRPRYE